ncbi:MAG: YMGG-like glycine zipper-containing protein [Mariprofundaceae bacterium]
MNKFALVVISILLLSGCATPHQERAATTGAMIGAGAGAVIGSQSDRPVEGALIGGVIGGLAGAILAEDHSDRVYTSDKRYHRKACRKGQRFFDEARHARSLERKVHLMEEGLRYCPANPAAHNDLGVALMLKGNYKAAEQHFRHAIRLDAGYEPARRNLAHVHRLMKRHGYKARGKHEKYERHHDYDDDGRHEYHEKHHRDRYDRHHDEYKKEKHHKGKHGRYHDEDDDSRHDKHKREHHDDEYESHHD